MRLHEDVGIAHLDIKLENILIDQNFDVRICDFGFSDDVRTR
jgi:serine/threonine protein kinase